MSKFIKTALSNFSNLFQTNDNNTTINTNAYTIPPMHQENNENINNDDTIDFDSLFGSTENITATDDKDSNNSDESKSITPEEVGATIAVTATSILSGVTKIIEYIDDGVAWAGGKVTEGVSWLVGETAGLFSENAKDSIMKWRENVKKNVKNEIDRDKVGELNEWFYEYTKIGQDINDASYLKYDSDAAKTTQNVTTKIGEIGGATALTILTGGAAAPLVFGVGCAEGIGKTAEATYQNGGDFDDGTLSIMLSGGLNGMSWVANGKLVQGAFEIIKDAASVGLLETGTTILNDTLLNKEFWSNTIKNGLSLKTMSSSGNSVINVNALMNYGSSLMSIGGDFVDVLNSDEGFTPKNIMILGTRYLTALGLNVLEDSGREYISSYKAGDIASTLSEEKIIYTEWENEDIINTDGYNKICENLIRQSKNKQTTKKLEKILYDGGYNGSSVLSGRDMINSCPGYEAEVRLGMAELLLNNPDDFDDFMQSNIRLYHGTNSAVLPSILENGVMSMEDISKNNIELKTGEEWSRGLRPRGFVSWTDDLNISKGYAYSQSPSKNQGSFPVIVCTSSDEVKIRTIYSDIYEIGSSSLPKEGIKAILTDSENVDKLKEIIGDREIKVLNFGGKSTYMFDKDCGEIYSYE